MSLFGMAYSEATQAKKQNNNKKETTPSFYSLDKTETLPLTSMAPILVF